MAEPATPLPWYISDGVRGYITDGSAMRICECFGDLPLSDRNAAYIAEACNNYQRLQAELSELRDYVWHLHKHAIESGVHLPSWDDWCRYKEQSR